MKRICLNQRRKFDGPLRVELPWCVDVEDDIEKCGYITLSFCLELKLARHNPTCSIAWPSESVPLARIEMRDDLVTLMSIEDGSRNVSIVVHGNPEVTFRVHKCMLSARCEYFRVMFESSMAEARPVGEEKMYKIAIRDFSIECIRYFVHYIYCNEVCPDVCKDVAVAFELWLLADKYRIEHLKNFVKHEIACCLTERNVCDILARADAIGPACLELRSLCVRFAVDNNAMESIVMGGTAYEGLSTETVRFILSSICSGAKIAKTVAEIKASKRKVSEIDSMEDDLHNKIQKRMDRGVREPF